MKVVINVLFAFDEALPEDRNINDTAWMDGHGFFAFRENPIPLCDPMSMFLC